MTARRLRAIAPLHDPAYAALKALLIARTGHAYYADKDDQLWEQVAPRIAASGLTGPAAYLALLEAEPDGAEFRRLASALTINETFFFRFAEQFDALRRDILPALIAERRATRRLRIWSVGCSTGAEPYSIAVLLHDLLGAEFAGWRISITGTDIDDKALDTAREALFSPWTLRTLGDPERTRLFDREGTHYRLKPAYRGPVRFEHHNMIDLLDPTSALQFTDQDLILCRNVLIYFDAVLCNAMVGALADRLAAGGTLLLGHAEPNPDFARVAMPVEIAGVTAYRRRDEPPPPLPDPIAFDPPPAPSPAPPQPIRCPLAPPEPAPAADRPHDPVDHYLAALGAMALGEAAEAERGFRRALYLDSGFAMAHYLLGRHLLAEGRADEGRRALRNALRVAADDPHDAELREGDGMTAGALVTTIRHALANGA